MDKFLEPTASAFIVGPVIGQNVFPTSRVLIKRINQSSAPAVDPESVTVSLEEDYIHPVERPQERQRRAFSVGATLPSVELIRPHSEKPNSTVAVDP